jgi:hypothetical protein
MLLAGLALAQPPLRLKALKRDPVSRSRTFKAPFKTRTLGRSHVLIQFADGPNGDQLNELANRGVAVLSYVPDLALSVSASDDISFDGLNIQWISRLRPDEKISPELDTIQAASGEPASALIEFYSDVEASDARAIANLEGLVIQEHPDLLPNHLLVQGTGEQMLAMAEWDEVSYVFPASQELLRGRAVRGCAGALTHQGLVGQAVAIINNGWAGPSHGAADLKYAFVHVTEKLPADAAEVEIVRAFNEWAKYAKLTFSLTSNATDNRTIAVLFASGAHGDAYPFDGPGGVLAHTFYPVPSNPEPIAGDMHFDNDESWKIGADVDVFSIALHETGHALGLGHSDTPGDVMYPYYTKHTGLAPNDISAILQLYAAHDGTPNPPPNSPIPPAPNPLVLVVQTPPSSTTASSIAINGTASGGVGTVQVSWSTNQGAAGVAQASSPWGIAAVPLSIGLNVINIQASDSQQNRVSQNLIVTRQQALPVNPPPTPAPGPDTTPPSLTVLSPASSNIFTSASSLVVSGTASDNVGVAKITWSSSTGESGTATGTNQWATPPVPLYIGTTTVIIRAYDAAGNSSWRSLVVTRR